MSCSSGKQTYLSRAQAKYAARRMKVVGKARRPAGWGGATWRPYRCPECGMWHLTTGAPRPAARYRPSPSERRARREGGECTS